jgi:hypothetical protein
MVDRTGKQPLGNPSPHFDDTDHFKGLGAILIAIMYHIAPPYNTVWVPVQTNAETERMNTQKDIEQ